MENELPARLTFLITLILQCTIKLPINFTFCNSVQTSALSERAEPPRCVFLVGSQLEYAKNVQAQADKETKKEWREADIIPGISKVLQYLAKKRRTNKINKNWFHASEGKKKQEKSYFFSVDANSFNLQTLKSILQTRGAAFYRPHFLRHSAQFIVEKSNMRATFYSKWQLLLFPHRFRLDNLCLLSTSLLGSRNTQQSVEHSFQDKRAMDISQNYYWTPFSLSPTLCGFSGLLLASRSVIFLRLTPFLRMKREIWAYKKEKM